MSGIKHNGALAIKTGEPDIDSEEVIQQQHVHINGEACGKIKIELIEKEKRLNEPLARGNIVKCQYVPAPDSVLSENIFALLPADANGRAHAYNHPEELFAILDNILAPFISIFSE